ncbi:hypothetical protein MVEN_01714800 [Mycena venus]|uniref:Uncharacterized protein n=1 Tax=Mycena venus TaxID=2733690 RepID=A0A8H6XPI7_9AGAR|nr:hypothetical protein MVEN_01714800 [Mycena venus]
MASLNLTETPNPLTPLAFFPPDIAYKLQISLYIGVGTLGAYVWDILSNLHNDYRLITTQRVGLGTWVYFFSRIWSFLHVFASTLYGTYPLKWCSAGETFVLASYSIAMPANSLLFFLRARAIFNRNPYLVAFFFCLWLSVVATAAALPTSATGGTIGPTAYCVTSDSKPYAIAMGITPVIHDTVIFLAISWRLFGNSHIDRGLKGNIRAFFTGEYLPRFSKAVLKDGQLYYLCIVASNILVLIMFYNTRVGVEYRVMFTDPNLMITNTMVCLVFRNTKFGYHNRVVTTSELSQNSGSIFFMQRTTGNNSSNKVPSVDAMVKVTNVTEQMRDPADSRDTSRMKVAVI